jgi:hypothetical protein
MRWHWLAGLIVLGAVALSGCAESRAYKSYEDEINSWSYGKRFAITWKDWWMDATDIVSLDMGAGENIGVTVQPTELLQAGALFGDVMKFGYRSRGLGFYRESRSEYGFSAVYYRDMQFEPIMGTPSLFERPRAFKGFPIRFNKEWHWMDLGAEVGVVFFSTSAHVSPKEALDFAVSTLMLPVNLFVRPPLDRAGVRMPEVDICEDDTASRLRAKYDLELIRQPEMFGPTETLNELVRTPY